MSDDKLQTLYTSRYGGNRSGQSVIGFFTPAGNKPLKASLSRPVGLSPTQLYPVNPKPQPLLGKISNFPFSPASSESVKNSKTQPSPDKVNSENDTDSTLVEIDEKVESEQKSLDFQYVTSGNTIPASTVPSLPFDISTLESEVIRDSETQLISGLEAGPKDARAEEHLVDSQCFDDCNMQNFPTGKFKPRCKTVSVCSTCSVEDSPSVQSRCSFCDGCSSEHSSLGAGKSDVGGIDSDCLDGWVSMERDTTGHCQHRRSKTSEPVLYPESFIRKGFQQKSEAKAHCEGSCISDQDDLQYKCMREDRGAASEEELLLMLLRKSGTSALTKEQLMFLLLRVQISRYRFLMDEVTSLRKLTRSQLRTVASLIQAVVVLHKRLLNTSHQWTRMQVQITQLQARCRQQQRHHRQMMVGLCVMVGLYLLNIPGVRRRLLLGLQFFGIVDTVKKINRTRKMISENWRNIPSLLTEFWRIFIFRSRSRLAADMKT